MRTFFWSSILLLLLSSCVVDYNVGLITGVEKMIVVNGYLDPDNYITIQLYKHGEDEKANTVGLIGAHILLTEDNNVLYDDICNDSVFNINHYPKVGSKYTIEVSTSKFETVKAITTVPHPVVCDVNFDYGSDNWWEWRDDLVTINNFKFNTSTNSSLWIIAFALSEDDKVVQYNELYTNNEFVDETNSIGGMGAPNNIVGGMYNEGFIRVKGLNTHELSEIIFTPVYVSSSDHPGLGSSQNRIRVDAISASAEFDKYNRSLFEQKSMIVYEEDITSIFYQPKGVYSNVINGTGIFAGISKTVFNFEYPQPEE